MASRLTGTVKFFSEQKGFGFIEVSGHPDVFVHATALEASRMNVLAKGQRVSFETEPDRKGRGPKAVRLAAA